MGRYRERVQLCSWKGLCRGVRDLATGIFVTYNKTAIILPEA